MTDRFSIQRNAFERGLELIEQAMKKGLRGRKHGEADGTLDASSPGENRVVWSLASPLRQPRSPSHGSSLNPHSQRPEPVLCRNCGLPIEPIVDPWGYSSYRGKPYGWYHPTIERETNIDGADVRIHAYFCADDLGEAEPQEAGGRQ
jgi:hypothetical protein